MLTLKVAHDDRHLSTKWYSGIRDISVHWYFDYRPDKELGDAIDQALMERPNGMPAPTGTWHVSALNQNPDVWVDPYAQCIVLSAWRVMSDDVVTKLSQFIIPTGCGFLLGPDGKTIDRVG